MATAMARNVGIDSAQFVPPAWVRVRNHAVMKAAVAANEAAITDSGKPRKYVHAVSRMPAIMARMRPTASRWIWCAGARGT